MCYTIEIYLSRKAIEERFSVDASPLEDFDFRYFYSAFTNPFLPVVTQDDPEKIQLMQWGLIPHWTQNMERANQIRGATYNARSESIHEKASFRRPFKSQRCWVIGHGFFEWQQRSNQKIPWYINLNNNSPFVFAGLYDSWTDPETGEIFNTFSIITTKANTLLEKIHNTKKRMPVILDREIENAWINPNTGSEFAKSLLLPFPENQLKAHPVSREILKLDTDAHDPAVIEPVLYPSEGLLFDQE